jgi:hypothetical protein
MVGVDFRRDRTLLRLNSHALQDREQIGRAAFRIEGERTNGKN